MVDTFLGVIFTIIILGGIKSIMIFCFLFYGLGFKDIVGVFLALALGIAVTVYNAPANSVIVNHQGIKIVNNESVFPSDAKDSFTKTLVTKAFDDLKQGLSFFFIMIPFLLIDLVGIIIFKILEVGWYQVSWLTFPAKIFLFLSVDGVSLISNMVLVSNT